MCIYYRILFELRVRLFIWFLCCCFFVHTIYFITSSWSQKICIVFFFRKVKICSRLYEWLGINTETQENDFEKLMNLSKKCIDSIFVYIFCQRFSTIVVYLRVRWFNQIWTDFVSMLHDLLYWIQQLHFGWYCSIRIVVVFFCFSVCLKQSFPLFPSTQVGILLPMYFTIASKCSKHIVDNANQK